MKGNSFNKARSLWPVLIVFVGGLGIVTALIASADTGTATRAPLTAGTATGNTWATATVKAPLKSPVKKPSTPPSRPAISGPPEQAITAGDSKVHCITLTFPDGVLNQSVIDAASSLTGITYNCLGVFADVAETWAVWETPWMFSTASEGWDAWLAASPARDVVMTIDLIPAALSDNSNPLAWEQPCAAGDYNQYATTLAKNLVSYGAGSIVIRLGAEANGDWEYDDVGTTSTEMSNWAKCYDNEVAAMRAVAHAHFLFVWNPNICSQDIPLSGWYPGNSYVDIIGADAYDLDCETGETVSQEGWTAYFTDSAISGSSDPDFPSLANIEAFAVAHEKPMSFPEFGLCDGKPDDGAYMTDMMDLFKEDDFAFESYFDTNTQEIAPLGSVIPDATSAYTQAFK